MEGDGLALHLRNLSKRFGGTQALNDVSLDVRRGTIHALLGGNGSGKSTTIKILAGVYPADSGTVEVLGIEHQLEGYTSDTAKASGLRFVHQDLGLFHDLSIEENFALGTGFPRRAAGSIDWKALRRNVARTLDDYELALDPRSRIGDLRPSDRTMVAIARALQNDESKESVLMLDEPTASLGQAESEHLLQRVRQRAELGQTVVIVSHRMREVLSVAHDFTIFRDGKVVGTLIDASPTEEEIVSIMAGGLAPVLRPQDAASHVTSEVVFQTRNLRGGPLDGVDFTLHEGEILGVAGLVGSGRSSLMLNLFGQHTPTGGVMELRGAPYAPTCVMDAMDRGIGLVPEDRGAEAAFPDRSLSENMSVAVHQEQKGKGWMSRSVERATAADFIGRLSIRASGPDAPFSSMSGGNQQKVVISRWLQRNPKLLLLDEPTQGVDIMSRADIYAIIRQAASTGCAVLVASSDMSELIALCDRIMILREGRATESIVAADYDVDELTKIVLIDPKDRRDGTD